MKPSLKFEVLFDDEVISFVGESQTLFPPKEYKGDGETSDSDFCDA